MKMAAIIIGNATSTNNISVNAAAPTTDETNRNLLFPFL